MARPLLLEGVGPVRFGFVTDTHNADRDDNGNRYYRDVPDKIADAVSLFNSRSLDFIYVNGDTVDGYGGSGASLIDLNGVMTSLSAASARRYFNAGNHDYQAFTLAGYAAVTGMDPVGYYCVDIRGVRFITLDANYETDDDGSHYSAGGFSYTDTYINPAQRTWLSATLASAPGKVVVFCHQRLELQVGANYVKNADAVRAILEAANPKVVGVLMGHAHVNSLTYINGIPYVVMQALIEGAHPLNAYAIGTVGDGLLSIEGFGQQTNQGLLDPFPAARPLIERFTTPPTTERAELIETTLEALDAAGLRAKLDCLYLAGADEQCSRQNWIQDAYNLTANGSPAFTSDRGFYGNGNGSGVGTAELLSGFNPTTAAGHFVQNDASIGFYVNDSPSPTTASSFDYSGGNGTTSSGATFSRPLTSASAMAQRLNTATTVNATLDVDKRTRLGFKAISRVDGTHVSAYANGVKQGSSIANTSVSPFNADIRILHAGSAGTTYGQDRVAAAFWGAGLSDAEMTDLYDIILDYLTAIGAN